MAEFNTLQERALIVALEAQRRGLWTAETALAFGAYCADDEDRVGYWETTLLDVVDAEESERHAHKKMEQACDAYDDSLGQLAEAQNLVKKIEVPTGALTVGRTAMFGDRRK
jgi:hypothetical protein